MSKELSEEKGNDLYNRVMGGYKQLVCDMKENNDLGFSNIWVFPQYGKVIADLIFDVLQNEQDLSTEQLERISITTDLCSKLNYFFEESIRNKTYHWTKAEDDLDIFSIKTYAGIEDAEKQLTQEFKYFKEKLKEDIQKMKNDK
ncbi:hypothetical protein HOK51_06250 [Candidatus Woesearchaeota archaeon]|jgi:hypothetical protein|nr:hypothetical protein [Candidatus Woesearchaeota archaeon]MBT7368912.1 hypothetical protein [Candidatus Woesearchaeota archaeon]